jgi:cell division protease FtsH
VVAEPAARVRPTILFVLLLFWLMRRAGNVQNVLGAFGRSRASRYQPSADRVTFADVAGIDEAKEELSEVVDFLRSPEKYRRLGGRIPTACCSRARRNRQDAPRARRRRRGERPVLLDCSFRVRRGDRRRRCLSRPDLFDQAKQAAPAIVFIDELDAIGRSRTSGVAGFSGGNDEREQTLNQILTEMDGFDSSDKRDRDRRDEPPRRARHGAASARSLRPPGGGFSPRIAPAGKRS